MSSPGFRLTASGGAGDRVVELAGVVTLADGPRLWRELRDAVAATDTARIDLAAFERRLAVHTWNGAPVLESPGQPLLDIFTEPEQMERFLRQAAAISEHTYQSKLLQSGLAFSEALLRQMQARAADGEARGYLLRDQGEAIAFAWWRPSGRRASSPSPRGSSSLSWASDGT